ncbi:hypothetical protein LVJ94_43550 [Pendulispora rubella]|uniref:Uncharacterized protein n=1 Tax=Pendulispora rubella TaxID=2741070 RepID=A0ABZ2KYM2_9BACT
MSLVVSLGAAACATIWGFDDLSLDHGTVDGGADAPFDGRAVRCDVTAPFTVISPPLFADKGNIKADRQGISLSADERRIYFGWDPDPPLPDGGGSPYNWKLMMATRDTPQENFGEAQPLAPPINGTYLQRHPTLDREETMIVFAARDGGTDIQEQLFYARRDASSQPFGPPQRLPALINEDPGYNIDPFLYTLPDAGKELWYVHGTTKVATLRRSRILNDHLSAPSSFGPPEEVNLTDDTEVTPVLSADGLELYFSREEGPSDWPNANIWRAHRTTTAEPFVTREEVVELNDKSELDRPGWLSPDGCRLYFLSSRDAQGTRALNIYMADRTKSSP